MEGLDYNIAIAIFFPFYVAAEIPSNMILKRFRPSIWFTVIMVTWGLVMYVPAPFCSSKQWIRNLY